MKPNKTDWTQITVSLIGLATALVSLWAALVAR